jgi:hypothetical protein
VKHQSAHARHRGGHEKHAKNKSVPPLPTVVAPLDGRQYQNIVEEQKYSEQRPTREEQQPRRANLDKTS